jgi:hypothetical protein
MEPTFLLRTVEDAEWGTLKAAANGEVFLAISPDSPAPVIEWYKRQTLELQMLEGPAEVQVSAKAIRSPHARVKPLGGTTVAQQGSLRFEVVTPYEMGGKQLTLEVRSRDSRSPEPGLSWCTHLSVTV